MRFVITPDEAQYPASVMFKHFKRQQMKVKVEKAAWPDAPYRTTLVAEKAGRHVIVEAQGSLSYDRSLKELVAWLAVRRYYAEVYLATTDDAVLKAGILQEMKVDGVGLYVISDAGVITEQRRARNHALVVTPDPTLKYGASKAEVQAAVHKFNETDRKDGLRDMCEVVERLTEEVGVAACRKKWLKMPEAQFRSKDWSNQINELSRKEAYKSNRNPVLIPNLKDDMHSFRGARNLLGHKVRSRREETRRQKQFADRMMQGPRLAADLISIKRRIK